MAAPQLKAGEKEVLINLKADKDAALGEHVINVTGKPAKTGAPGTTKFQIEVEKAE
jgi:hypothetical protein